MAIKPKKKMTLEDLARIVAGQFARVDASFTAVQKDIGAIRTDVGDIRKEMRAGFQALHEEIAQCPTRSEMRDELEKLRLEIKNSNHATEIDDLRRRVKKIEAHLGLK